MNYVLTLFHFLLIPNLVLANYNQINCIARLPISKNSPLANHGLHAKIKTYAHSSNNNRTASCTSDLYSYSSDQLKEYFTYHGYTEKNILSQQMLYVSDEFVKLAKTYPNYEYAITSIHRKLHKMSTIEKLFRTYITKSYSSQLKTRIDQLYAELHCKQKPSTINSHRYEYEYAYLRDDWTESAAISYDQKTKNRLNKRIHALDQHYKTTCNPPDCIHKGMYIFAQNYAINLAALVPNNSSAITHVLYQEFVDILESASHIPKKDNDILIDVLGQTSHTGLDANKAGCIEYASKLADFCWLIVDYTKAIGEGVCLGAYNTLHTCAHPLQTAKNALIGIGVITYGLANITDFMQNASFLYITDNNQFFLRFNTIQEQLHTITNAATTYLTFTKSRDIVKDGVVSVTEGFFLGKIFNLIGNISKQLLPLATQYFEYITMHEPLVCFADGALIPIKMGPNLFFSKSTQRLAPISNAINFLQNIDECLIALSKTQKNKIHHILMPTTGKHAWHLVVKNPLDWNQVARVIEQVLIDGTISPYGPVFKKELSFKGNIVEVIIAPFDDGSLSIVDAWVKTR